MMETILGYVQFVYLAAGLVCFLILFGEKRWLVFIFLALAVSGMALHSWYIVWRWIRAARPPFSNTFETLILLSFLVMLAYMISLFRYRITALGGFAGLVSAICLAASSLLSPEIHPLLPALKSNWLIFHVVSNFVAYASFALALGSGMLYLILSLRKPAGRETVEGMDGTSPLFFLDWLTYRFIAFGFPLLTLGIATGAVWANLSWGRYWNWDPKETWAFVTWMTYAAILHMRYVGSLRGKITALFAVLGFCFVMFTYFGVNYWLSSLHAAYA